MGFYEILVAGELEKYRESYFGGLETEKLDDGTTCLKGYLEDISALYGIVNKIRDAGLEMIRFERTDYNKT